MSALKRIKKELDEVKRNPPVEVMVGPTDDSNFFRWEGMLRGPEDTPYAGGIFKFTVEFPEDYPMNPPIVKFTTKVYHPNISEKGDICVTILKEDWSSVYTISKVMIAISGLLTDPNPSSAYNAESARLYTTDRSRYNQVVKDWVKKYASPENM